MSVAVHRDDRDPTAPDPHEAFRATPEGRLWLRVIASAVRDLTRPKHQTHSQVPLAIRQANARRFLLSEQSALHVVAPLLGLDIHAIRERLEQRADCMAHSRYRTRPHNRPEPGVLPVLGIRGA